eukprot:g81603.t1
MCWLLFLAWTGVFGSHLIQQPIDECLSFNRPLRVGVQHEESAEYAAALWNATIGSYLSNFLKQFGCQGAELAAVLDNDDMYSRVEAQLAGNLAESDWLDMLLVSPGLVAGLHRLHVDKIETLATLQNVHQGTVTDLLAGVLVRLKNENTFLVDWTDLSQPAAQGLTLCAVRHDSFSGFQIQDLEALQQVGLRLEEVFNVSFVLSHDQVLEDVASGKCALGTVGTGHLERVASTGLIHPPYSVLALDLWAEVGKPGTDMFPLLHSTRLYPEWGWAALVDHIPARLAELVRVGLMALDDAHPAAVQGEHAGFTFPADYHEVELVEYHLDFFQDGRCPASYEREASGTRICKLCPKGKFKATEVGVCEECPVRSYSNVMGATACLSCEEGYSSYREGATECELEDNTGYIPIKSCEHYDNNTLVVGVLTVLDAGLVYKRWHPTFETLLNGFMNKFGCFVRMVELNWTELPHAVAQGTIDFAFLDSGMYIRLEHQHGLRAECSVLRNYQGAVTGYIGGVIFRRADRHPDLNSLEDLQNASQFRSLRACPVDHNSFSGWSIQRYEFFKQHIDVLKVFDEIVFSESHDESVAMVSRGECDVGMAQTNTLERLIHAHAYAHDTFALINEQHHEHFHQQVSTNLYHEWPFAVMPHVEDEIWRRLVVPLLAISEHDEVAIRGEHAGFTDFHSYEEAANVEFQLNLVDNTTGLCAPGFARNYTDPLQGCSKCGLGRFNADGLHLCHACDPGFYGDEEGLLECKRCDPGKITHHFGETHCVKEGEVLLYHPIEACAAYPNKTLVVGVLMEEDEHLMHERWQPTFEGVLNEYMNRFQCYFEMVALDWLHVYDAVASRSIDFIFLDSGGFTILERKFDVQVLATVVRFFSGRPYAQEGGVIFARNGSSLSQQASSLEELQSFSVTHTNLTLCAVDNESFSGYDIQKYEFFKRGIRMEDLFDQIVFTEDNDLTVEMVLHGQCDVGMVRSHTIEGLLHAGKHEIEDFHILNEQIHQGFPILVSTALYHEWPFAVLPHVQDSIWSNARIPLLGMREFDSAAVKGMYAGFVQAEDYTDEAEVDYQLNLVDHVTGICAPGSARDYSNPLEPCVKCAKGHFNHDGMPVCHACDPGFFSDDQGLLECKRCPPGFISHDFGAANCIEEKDVLVYHPIKECANFSNATLVVGILSTASKELTHQTWDPTFDATLNEYFNRYQCKFRTRALDWHEVLEAVASNTIDLLFADAGLYTELHHKYGLEALASVLRDFNGFLSPHYGGVIFRNASENTDLHNLQDIVAASGQRKLRACPVDSESFAGWHAQWYEFFRAEIDVRQVFHSIQFSESDDSTVEWVAANLCDVGFVRTETLERLVHEGLYEIEQFAVINEKQFEGFVQVLSTELYPEWPIAALPHVPRAIADVVAIPLLAMRESDYAAKAGSHAGFTATYSYDAASEVRWQLALEPNATCGPGAFRDLTTKLHACRACPAGSFNRDGVGECVLCPVGYDAPSPRSATCARCPFGYNTLAPGGMSCVEYSQVIEMAPAAVYAVWGVSSLLFVFSSTLFGTLFSKTFRLYSIFRIYETKQKIPQAIKFKDTRVAGMAASFVAVTCVVLTIFFLVEPPFHVTRKAQIEGQEFYTYVEACDVSKFWVPFVFTCYTVVLCGQCWLAFRVRNLPTIFNESKLIAWLLYNTVFVGLVGIMVDFMLDWTQVTAQLMVRTVALLLGSCTPVAVLYGPKLLEIYQEQMNNSKYSSKDQTSTKTQQTYESQGGHTLVGADLPTSNVGAALPYKGIAVHPSPGLHKSRVGKSNKSHMSAVSGVSGFSDDEGGDWDVDIMLVPDSDVAGDEDFRAQFETSNYRMMETRPPGGAQVDIQKTRRGSKSISKEEAQQNGRSQSKSKVPALEECESNLPQPRIQSNSKIPALEERKSNLPMPRTHLRHSSVGKVQQDPFPGSSTSKEDLGSAPVHAHQLPPRSTSKEDLASPSQMLQLEALEGMSSSSQGRSSPQLRPDPAPHATGLQPSQRVASSASSVSQLLQLEPRKSDQLPQPEPRQSDPLAPRSSPAATAIHNRCRSDFGHHFVITSDEKQQYEQHVRIEASGGGSIASQGSAQLKVAHAKDYEPADDDSDEAENEEA